MKLRQDWVWPVTLAVAPVTATTPGHPGQLALWLGGFHLRAYHGEAAFPPPVAFAAPSCDAIVGAVACPARWLPVFALGDLGGASPSPMPSNARNVQFLGAFMPSPSGTALPGPRQLGTVAPQGKALTLEGQPHREADIFGGIFTPSM